MQEIFYLDVGKFATWTLDEVNNSEVTLSCLRYFATSNIFSNDGSERVKSNDFKKKSLTKDSDDSLGKNLPIPFGFFVVSLESKEGDGV